MKFERRDLLKSDAKLCKLAFGEGGVCLIEKSLSDRQHPGHDFALAGDVGKVRQRPKITSNPARCRAKLLLVVTEPEEIFRVGGLREGCIHAFEYGVECRCKLLATLRECIGRSCRRQPTQTRGKLHRGAAQRPSLCRVAMGRMLLLFFTNNAMSLCTANHTSNPSLLDPFLLDRLLLDQSILRYLCRHR